MKHVDTSVFIAKGEDRIKPEEVDLGSLPPIQKLDKSSPQTARNPVTKGSGLVDNPLFRRTSPLYEGTNFQERTPEQANIRTDEHMNTRTPEQVNTRTPERPNRRTPDRPIVRKSYNVFEDQHSALVRRELEGQIQGKPMSISDMVRTAIDDFLKKSS